MGFISEARPSDSPFVASITRGLTEGQGEVIRPAEICGHLVLVKYNGHTQLMAVGPLTSAGVVQFTEGVELLWIKLKLGTFMPHLPLKNLLNAQADLPSAAGQSFWLKGSAWQFPDFENADTFIDRLARQEVLVRDPVVNAALQGPLPDVPPRTLRHRFLRATGLTQGHIRQVERAQRAAALLQQGVSILDTVYETGYFDQPHLTRSLKQWVGHTPAQIARPNSS